MPKTIFISYRRDDEPGFARALHLALERRFADAVFFDIDIPAGDDFTQVLDAQIDQCDVLLPVIGRKWLELKDGAGKRRLDNPGDYVRFEIGTALKKRKRIIPILVNHAGMPSDEDLPYNLQGFSKLNARALTNDRFDADVNAIANAVEVALRAADTARQRFQEERARNPDGRNWGLAIVADPAEQERIGEALRHARPALELHSPVHGDIGGSQLRVAASHWRDATTSNDGIMSLIGNFFMQGFGVLYFTAPTAVEGGFVNRIQHQVLSALMMLLVLVFVPVTLCSLTVSFMALLAYYLFADAMFWVQVPFIAFGTLVAGLYFYRLARNNTRGISNRLAVPLFRAYLALCVAVMALILLDHPRGIGQQTSNSLTAYLINPTTSRSVDVTKVRGIGPIATHLVWVMGSYASVSGNIQYADGLKLLDETSVYIAFLRLVQSLFNFQFVTLTTLALPILMIILVSPWQPWGRRRRHLLAFSTVILLWLLLSLLLWPERLITSTVINLFFDVAKESWKPGVAYGIGLARWDVVSFEIRDMEHFRELIPLLWFDLYFFVFVYCLALVAGALWAWSSIWRWIKRGGKLEFLRSFRPPGQRRSAPRLLLPPLLQVLLLCFIVANCVTALAHVLKVERWVAETLLQLRVGTGALPHAFALNMSNVTVAVAIGLVMFLMVAHRFSRAALPFTDIVNHLSAPRLGYPVRRRNIDVFLRSVEGAVRGRDMPNLVVIAHGQGSMIMLDALFGYVGPDGTRTEGLWRQGLNDRVAGLTILTFGSPITHVYQHYFDNVYSRFADVPALVEASRDAKVRWFNAYRIDDHVGTWVDPSIENFPVNVPMPIGGHNNYWTPDIFARLFAEPGMERVLVDLTVPFESDADLAIQGPPIASAAQ